MKLENIALDKLVFDKTNARKHNRKNLDAIAASLAEFGQRKPIVITKDNVIIAGNGTVEVAKELGWKEVSAVRIPDDWSDAQIKAFGIADNRTAELAEWNSETLFDSLKEIADAGLLMQTGYAEPDIKALEFIYGDVPEVDYSERFAEKAEGDTIPVTITMTVTTPTKMRWINVWDMFQGTDDARLAQILDAFE